MVDDRRQRSSIAMTPFVLSAATSHDLFVDGMQLLITLAVGATIVVSVDRLLIVLKYAQAKLRERATGRRAADRFRFQSLPDPEHFPQVMRVVIGRLANGGALGRALGRTLCDSSSVCTCMFSCSYGLGPQKEERTVGSSVLAKIHSGSSQVCECTFGCSCRLCP